MANQDFSGRGRERAPAGSERAMPGDALYGDRDNLRRYRDAARDEHRRFAADYERRQGNLGRADSLVDYDRFAGDATWAEGGANSRGYGIDRPSARELRAQGAFQGGFRPLGSQAQQQRGRGPKGYQRSDRRIHEDICERLTDDDFVDASEIEVSVADGEVTLSGRVRSRTGKRRAAYVIEDIRGVKDVHNNIRVVDEQSRPHIARSG